MMKSNRPPKLTWPLRMVLILLALLILPFPAKLAAKHSPEEVTTGSATHNQETATGNVSDRIEERKSSPRLSEEQIKELLEEPLACDFGTEVSLETVLDRLGEKTSIPFIVNHDAIEALNYPPEIIVNAKLPFLMPLKSMLDYLVKQHHLAWHVLNDAVYITDINFKPNDRLVAKVYYVGDLLHTFPYLGKDGYMSLLPAHLDAIAEYLRTMVAPETWNEEVMIRPFQNTASLIIRQTESGHQQIADQLRHLRKTNDIQIHIEIKILTDDETDSEYTCTLCILNGYEGTLTPHSRGRECTATIAPISFRPVRDDLVRWNEPIQLRWPEGKSLTVHGVAGKRENQDTVKVTVSVEGEGAIVTKTFFASPIIQEVVEYPMELLADTSEKPLALMYDVADVAVSDTGMVDLVNLIKATVSPFDWGESATIEVAGTKLVIVHTSSGHESVSELLHQLRKVVKTEDANVYRLGPGDTVGIFIEGITGTGQHIPVYMPSPGYNLPPATGYAFTVRDDGTLALPKIQQSLKVKGLTLNETQKLICRTYVEEAKLLGSEAVITVSLIRPRDFPDGHTDVVRPEVPSKR